MSVNASPFGPCPQFELASGAPAVGNKLFFYVAGSTTKQNTYTDSTGATPNANPIVLDALGQSPSEIWFTAGQSYKVVYAPSTDTDPPTSPIRTWDNLVGINDTSITIDQWVASGLTPTYVSATQFTLVGDQTTAFHVGRRLKTTNSGGTIYSTISVSAYTSVTTITVVNDSGTLDAGLSAVSYGLLSVTNNAEPRGVFALLAGSASQAFSVAAATSAAHTARADQLPSVLLGTPEWYGAVGDGVTDDGAALQLWANYLSANISIEGRLSKLYLTNQTIVVNPDTTNGVIPKITGSGAQNCGIKAGATLGANPILKHQGASPSVNIQWHGFKLVGTGAANGQYGIHHINTCFVNYDGVFFDALQEWVRFENVGGGFTEQNTLSNCWGTNCKYALGFRRQAGSSTDSFRGTGFSGECHMNLTEVADSRLIRVYNDTALPPNLYDTPLDVSVWANASSILTQNDGTTPIRASGKIRYESTAVGWLLGSGSASDTFRGIIDGISYNPGVGTYTLYPQYTVDVSPAFSAAAASTQSITTGVTTKVTLGTEEFDTNGNFASSRFTPTIAGYYQINATLRIAGTTITAANIEINKSGSAYRIEELAFSAGDGMTMSGSIVLYLNGTTDYVELMGLVSATTPSFNYANAFATSRLSGSLIKQNSL